MARVALDAEATTKAKDSQVTERILKQQAGLIVLSVILMTLLVMMTPFGCTTLLAVLSGTGAAP